MHHFTAKNYRINQIRAKGIRKKFKGRHGFGYDYIRSFPGSMDPVSSGTSMAHAPLIVAAVSASAGSIFQRIQASDIISFMLPEGDEPGL
jgi:hypothetical protein